MNCWTTVSMELLWMVFCTAVISAMCQQPLLRVTLVRNCWKPRKGFRSKLWNLPNWTVRLTWFVGGVVWLFTHYTILTIGLLTLCMQARCKPVIWSCGVWRHSSYSPWISPPVWMHPVCLQYCWLCSIRRCWLRISKVQCSLVSHSIWVIYFFTA